jgi:hypothetical protein
MTPLDLPAWLVLVVVTLAAARLFRLIATDSITDPLRRRLRVEIAEAPKQWRDTISYFVQCPWCCGFWIAVLLTLTALAWADTLLWQIIVIPLAVNYAAASANGRQDVE